MARRSVLLLVAALIALAGTAMIVLYVQGIDARATKDQELVQVLVATDVIDTGESVAAAQEAGKFETAEVRSLDLVDGSLSSTLSVADLVAVGTIYPGEQLIARKFGSLADTQSLVIPDDNIAVSVELTDTARVSGFVNPGSTVAIFVSGEPSGTLPDGTQKTFDAYTRLLLPEVQVIAVGATSTTSKTTTDETGASTVEQLPKTILTVAVTQKQAEKIIYAQRNAELAFALLTEESAVRDEPGVTAIDIMPEPFGNAQ